MNRRCRNGSLVAYAGTNYDYTTPLEAGGKINLEHVNKIIEPLNAITSQSYDIQSVGDKIISPNILSTNLAAYEAQPMTKNGTSSCSASCSGLCVSNCWNACTGCTGSCSGGCQGSCQGCSSCSGSCSGACNSGCWGACGWGWF